MMSGTRVVGCDRVFSTSPGGTSWESKPGSRVPGSTRPHLKTVVAVGRVPGGRVLPYGETGVPTRHPWGASPRECSAQQGSQPSLRPPARSPVVYPDGGPRSRWVSTTPLLTPLFASLACLRPRLEGWIGPFRPRLTSWRGQDLGAAWASVGRGGPSRPLAPSSDQFLAQSGDDGPESLAGTPAFRAPGGPR